jgi:hypothetical protein
MGAVMKLCLERRGINKNYQYLTNNRLEMIFELPLAEVIYDFYDKLKSVTQGYGSFDYELIDFRQTDLVKLDILINGERVDALSSWFTGTRRGAGPHRLRKAAGRNPPADVQNRHPGGHRRQDHLPQDRLRLSQGRHRQMLRRRHHPQTQASGKTEKRQKTDENGGPGDDAPVRFLSVLKTDTD